jgi:hypothetical protein
MHAVEVRDFRLELMNRFFFLQLYPNGLVDVSSSQLNTFNLFEEYAAAAYCVAFDEASKGTVISCSAGNCPQPQTTGATLVYGFDG